MDEHYIQQIMVFSHRNKHFCFKILHKQELGGSCQNFKPQMLQEKNF